MTKNNFYKINKKALIGGLSTSDKIEKNLKVLDIINNYFQNQKIKKRLSFLFKKSLSRGEDAEEMQKDSLQAFLIFINRLSDYGIQLIEPEITLTPNGEIWADWEINENKSLSICFF